MPTPLTYPGVYIEELSSGVRTITGVSTSIATFVGWAAKGPTDRAQRIQSWADFERLYGGLDRRSDLSYGVYFFFLNGGQDAYIVRLAAADASAASASVPSPAMTAKAKNAGIWGNDYGVKIIPRTDKPERFRLEVLLIKPDGSETVAEAFDNLSADKHDSRFVAMVLEKDSTLISAQLSAATPAPTPAPAPAPTPAPAPAPATIRLQGGVDGAVLAPNDSAFETVLYPATGSGIEQLLDPVDLFNLLCVPGETTAATLQKLQKFCRAKRAFLIVDCTEDDTVNSLSNGPANLTGDDAINSAFYFPWVNAPDPLQENRPRAFPPSGFVAGLYAKTDANRGVFKAPAGTEVSLTGVVGVQVPLTNNQNGILNPKAVNCIRNFPVYGTVIWGARTLRGNDEVGSEWKYVPVRRLALFLEESLYRGTQWVVFEPNDEPLWSQIRLNIGAFMQNLFLQGAFQGKTPQDAYFVRCDKTTTTQNDINLGIVNIIVGFAPLKPAEFVVIKLQQIAGQIAV
jgi:phage tail sheath protein FI